MGIQSYLPYLFALLGAGTLNFLYRLYVHRRQFKDLPKPPHSFLWGHLRLMREAIAANPPDVHPQQILTYISMKYGMKGLYYLDLWPLADSQMVLDEPELMEAMQVTKVWDQHRAVNDAAETLVGINNLAAINGPMWKKLHNRLAPAFLPPNLRGQYGAMIEETMTFRNTLAEFAKSGQVFSLEAEGAKLIFDIMGRLIFNSPMGMQTEGNSIHDDLIEILHSTTGFNPINPLSRLVGHLQHLKAQKHVNTTLTAKIYERLREIKDGDIIPTRRNFSSVMDLLLNEKLTETSGEKGPSTDLSKVELDTLLSNIKGVFLGGLGTIAGTLSFVHMLLSKHPEVLARLQEEHRTVFNESLSKTVEMLKASPAKLHDMECTTAVIKEALRLFPIGLLFKQAPQGATLKWQNRDYPAEGFVVIPNQHVLHFNPAYYPNPGQFKPERFLSNAIPRSWFRSFGRGARSCIGQNLAMDVIRINLLLTLRDWKFDCHDLKPNTKPKMPYTDMDMVFGDIIFQLEDFEAKPRGGMMMTVKKLDAILA